MAVNIPINTSYIKTAMQYLTPECKLHYVYGMMAVCESIDGYVMSLIDYAKIAGIYRMNVAWLCNNIDKDYRRYKASLVNIDGGKRMREALHRALELLNQEYHGYMWGLHRAIDQAALGSGFPGDISKCIASASMINILAQYVRFNDNKLAKALEKITLQPVMLSDPNISLMEKRSGKLLEEIEKLFPKWKINMNDVEDIKLALKVIDVQLGRINEVIEKL